jgi:hypothetical protein
MFTYSFTLQFKLVKISFNTFQNQLEICKVLCAYVVGLYSTFQNDEIMVVMAQQFSGLGGPEGFDIRK